MNDMPAHVREECCGGQDAAVEEVVVHIFW